MVFSAERTVVADCPASCSYNTKPHLVRSPHNRRLPRRWLGKPSRQPSGAVLRVSAEQQAASQKETHTKAKRPQDIAGRPVADSTPYDMPVPMDYEQTLQKAFTVAGIGLHSGEFATVRVRPAYAGEGRYFVRVPNGTIDPDEATKLERELDEADAEAEVRAEENEEALTKAFMEFLSAQDDGYQGSFEEFYWERFGEECPTMAMRKEWEVKEQDASVVRRGANEATVTASLDNVARGQSLLTSLSADDMHVHSVEALLSALECCGVDNCRIEMEGGGELPTLDGSAMGWAINIIAAGVHAAPSPEGSEAPHKLRQYKPRQMLTVSRGDSFITFNPSDMLKISCGVDHAKEAPVIGRQWFSWAPFEDDHYRWIIAPAKTFFKTMKHVFELRARGLIKGGTVGVALIGYGWGWYEGDIVHFEDDEPARHRIIDLTGDLALLATPGTRGVPIGHIIAHNADHALNIEFVKALRNSFTEDDLVDAAAQPQQEVASSDQQEQPQAVQAS